MEFTYKIDEVKVYDTDTQKDVIKEATLHIIGTQDGVEYQSFMPIELAEPSESFTSFDDLTSSQVETWVKNVLGEDQLQANKDGLASLPNNPFKVGAARIHPVEKALKE